MVLLVTTFFNILCTFSTVIDIMVTMAQSILSKHVRVSKKSIVVDSKHLSTY